MISSDDQAVAIVDLATAARNWDKIAAARDLVNRATADKIKGEPGYEAKLYIGCKHAC